MRIASLFALPLLLLAGSTTTSQPPVPVVQVHLADYSFTPETIVLDHGKSYVLRLVNASDGGHDFSAPTFFDAASVATDDRRWVMEGAVEVSPGQTRDIHLTAPAAGRYKLKCTHSFHKMFGMSGKIVVR